MTIGNAISYIVGATLAVAQPKEGRPARPPSSGAGGGKLCPYNLRKSLPDGRQVRPKKIFKGLGIREPGI
jgi:hypothetical protein